MEYYKIKSKTINNFFKCILNHKITKKNSIISAKLYISKTDLCILFNDNTNWALSNRIFSKSTGNSIKNIENNTDYLGKIILNKEEIYYVT